MSEQIGEGLERALEAIKKGKRTLDSLRTFTTPIPSILQVQEAVVDLLYHALYFLQEAWDNIGRGKACQLINHPLE